MERSYELSSIQGESGAETSRQQMTSLPRWIPKQYSIALLAALVCAADAYAHYSLIYLQTDDGEDLWESVEMFIGTCTGTLLTLGLMHVYGRKFAAVTTAIVHILYFLKLWVLSSSKWLRVSAFLVGIGSGGTYLVIPTYLVEIAEETSRGRMGVIILVMKLFGNFMASSLALISQRWIEHIISMALGFLFLAAIVWIPETPYFLISTGRRDEALRSLRRLTFDEIKAQQKLQVLEESTQEYARRYSTWGSRLVNREAMKAVAVAGGLIILQIIGFPSINNIFRLLLSVHYTTAECMVHLLLLVITFIPLFLVDRVKRRVMLMSSAAGTAACYGVLAFMQYMDSHDEHLVVQTIVEFVLVITYYLGMGCLPLIISVELMPNGVRAVGFATVMCIHNISIYIFLNIFKLYPLNMIYYLGVCCGFSISCIIYVIFVLPETKGKIL